MRRSTIQRLTRVTALSLVFSLLSACTTNPSTGRRWHNKKAALPVMVRTATAPRDLLQSADIKAAAATDLVDINLIITFALSAWDLPTAGNATQSM